MKKTTAERVRELRKALKLSLEKFANETDLSFSLLSKAETGVVPVTEEMLEKISKRWKCPFQWLSKGEGEFSFEKSIKTELGDNPWREEAYKALKEEVIFYRQLITQMTGGKSFLQALNQTGSSEEEFLRADAA